MPVDSVFNTLLGSESRVRILRLFTQFTGLELTKRELARMIDMSHTAVNAAVPVLLENRILRVKFAGRSHIYSINQDSYLFSALCGLFEKERAFRPQILDRIRSGLDGVGKCTLFGSFARGEEGPNSDIDLLIVTKDKKRAEKAVDDLRSNILDEFGLSISPIILTKSELRSMEGKPVYKNIRTEGIVLVE